MKRLYRSRKEKMIAGVCGGLAEYFGIDPVFVRALFIIAVFAEGIGLIAYIILWIIAPIEDQFDQRYAAAAPEGPPEPPQKTDPEKLRNRNIGIGIVLIALGAIFLTDNIFSWVEFGIILPVLIIAIGAYILFSATKKSDAEAYNEN